MDCTLRRLCVASTVVAASCGSADPPLSTAVSVTDDAGRVVGLPAPASRVFSALPSLTESVAALDPEVLVARTRFDRAPALAHLPSLGGTLRPNIEAMAQLRPDLVIVWMDGGQQSVAERVEALGIPVYRAEVLTVDDVRSHLRRLGVLVDREERAEVLVDSLDRALREVSEAVAGKEPVGVYFSVWHDPPQTTGPGTFIDEVIERAGGRNVFRDAAGSWPQISLEEVVRRDPDVLVIAQHQGGSSEAPWVQAPGWRELSAVRQGRYLVVDADLFNRPGPRMPEAARTLARFLHGEDVLESSPSPDRP